MDAKTLKELKSTLSQEDYSMVFQMHQELEDYRAAMKPLQAAIVEAGKEIGYLEKDIQRYQEKVRDRDVKIDLLTGRIKNIHYQMPTQGFLRNCMNSVLENPAGSPEQYESKMAIYRAVAAVQKVIAKAMEESK